MNAKMNRFLAALLSLVMLLSLIPASVFAAEEASNAINMSYDDRLAISTLCQTGEPTITDQQVTSKQTGTDEMDAAVVKYDAATGKLVAVGVGTAVVTWGTVSYDVTVTAAPISLFLLIGQSNMEGSAGDPNGSIANEDGQVYSTYGIKEQLTVSNAAGFIPQSLTAEAANALTVSGAGKKGMDSGIAYQWTKLTGEKVWLVNASHGASIIDSWQPGVTSGLESTNATSGITYPIQSGSLSLPKSAADVHPDIHYRQVGYNELGIEAATNTYYLLNEDEQPQGVAPKITLYKQNGYSQWSAGDKTEVGVATLVVPVVSPVYCAADLKITAGEGATYKNYLLTGGAVTFELAGAETKVITAVAPANKYEWNFDEGLNTENIDNELIPYLGSASAQDGQLVAEGAALELAKGLKLSDTENWIVEWEIDGDIKNHIMFSPLPKINTTGSWYILRNGNKYFLGVRHENAYKNFLLSDDGYTSGTHTFTLKCVEGVISFAVDGVVTCEDITAADVYKGAEQQTDASIINEYRNQLNDVVFTAKYLGSTQSEKFYVNNNLDSLYIGKNVDARVYVAEADGVKYETLEEAMAEGGEVKLLANYEIAKVIKVENTVTLDLNGYKLTGSDDGKANWYAFVVDVNGDLTLTDSVGTGELYAKCYGVETKGGKFTLESGKITATKNKTVGTAIVNYGGEVIINGGSLSGTPGSKVTVTFGSLVATDAKNSLNVSDVTYSVTVMEEPTEPTEPSTEATEPSTEATEPSTEATEAVTEGTEATTEATEPVDETEPEGEPTTEPDGEPTTEPDGDGEPETRRFPWWLILLIILTLGIAYIIWRRSKKNA